jgi:hypothetical protein
MSKSLPFLNEVLTYHKTNQKQNKKSVSIIHLNNEKIKKINNTISVLPEEVYLYLLRFLSAKELARTIALLNKKNNFLWTQAVHTFEVQGILRKFKEDNVVKVIKRFDRLENLNFCNTGSSDDFQLTDKGLLAFAHKYIYIDSDHIAKKQMKQMRTLKKESLLGFNFNFDYEQHLDSIHEDMTETDTFSEFDNTEITEEDLMIIKKMDDKENEEDKKEEEEEGIEEEEKENMSIEEKNVIIKVKEEENEKIQKKRSSTNPQFGLKTLKTLNLTGKIFL